MPALHELQRAFGASIITGDDAGIADHIVDDGFCAAERLGIYRNSCRSVLTEALRLTYPAVDRLVGRDFFDMAAAAFLEEHVPASGYLNEHGAAFADFLAALRSAAELPYLPDVARFEWALNQAANAVDAAPLDPAVLAEIAPQGHAALRFEPHPSVRFLELTYPADRIADAVLSGDDEAMAAIDLASGPVRLVVHRGPQGVEAERLDLAEYRFVERLCAGERLAALLETAVPNAAALLAQQFTKGRLMGFRIAPSDLEDKELPA